MVLANTITEAEEKSVVLDPLNSRASRQVEEILDRRPDEAVEENQQAAVWYYRIPCAGVRYYNF